MRLDISAPSGRARRRQTAVKVFPADVSPTDVLLGDDSGVAYTTEVESVTHTHDSATLTMVLPAADVPESGQCVSILSGGQVAFNGVIETVDDDEERGLRKAVTVTVRRRDASEMWRTVKRTSQEFWTGTNLGQMARSCVTDAGLTAAEFDIPDVGVALAHDRAQIADLSLWEQLVTALEPGLLEPFVDARGFLKTISRDVTRPNSFTLADRRDIKRTHSTLSTPAPTAMLVKYPDPIQVQVIQSHRQLATETISVGWFNNDSTKDVWWSDDKTQRALVTGSPECFKIKQSVGGLVDGADYEVLVVPGPFGGEIRVGRGIGGDYFALLTAIGAATAGSALGSIIPLLGGLVEGAALAGVFAIIMNQGAGVYEVWGRPYDWVTQVNEVETFDQNAPAHRHQVEEFESNLIPNDEVALTIATAELFHRISAAKSSTMTVLDDLRYEPGDLIGLPDGKSFYVTGYVRDLSPRSEALVDLTGFKVGGQYAAVRKW